MRVVIIARQGDGTINALGDGCQAAGYKVVWQRPSLWSHEDYDPKATAVFVHGLTNGNARNAYRTYREKGVPVWIMDLPRLREDLLALGFYLNGFQWLPADIVREPVTLPMVENRSAEVALVCGQKPGDNSHGMDAVGMYQWARRTIETVREATGLPVVYRPHPKDVNQPPADGFGADMLSDPRHTDLQADFARAAVVVTHNSTTGWEAIAAGVPVHATDPDCAYREYTTELDAITDLPSAKRAEALGRAASSQWTMYEVCKPEVITHLFAHHDGTLRSVLPTTDHTDKGANADAVTVVDTPKRPKARKAKPKQLAAA